MKDITDSVQQIVEQCNNLIDTGLECEFYDVRSLSQSVKEACDDLKAFWNEHPEDTCAIRNKKRYVEDLAIRLEFFMVTRLHMYEDRYKLRNVANNIYGDLKQIAREVVKENKDKAVVLKWSNYLQWSLVFYGRSLHLLFELDDEDEQMLVEITEAVKAYKEGIA